MEFARDTNRPIHGLITPTEGLRSLSVGVFLLRERRKAGMPTNRTPKRRAAKLSLRACLRGFAGVVLYLIAGFGCSVLDERSDSVEAGAELTAPGPRSVRAQDGDAAPVAQPNAAPAAAATSEPSLVMAPFGTGVESLFGEASTTGWAPLLFQDLLTEGWDQPFVFSPASDSGALRQEWINSANGVFYRQWVLDYNYRNHVDPSGSRDIGTWSVFAPLSRRLELFVSIPFVDYHKVDSPVASTTSKRGDGSAGNPSAAYQATFGDISITPQVLLHETKNTSIMSILTVRTPTGSIDAGNGESSLGPQLQFWQGLPDRWVIRGGAGPTIPVSSTGLRTTFDTNLTIGRFLTLDEVKYFKEFTLWTAVNNSATMDNRGPGADFLTILPGLRFRLTKNSWFLYGVEVPLVAPRHEDFGMYIRFVKRF